jgi:predicted O-methyltransferase YrrM
MKNEIIIEEFIKNLDVKIPNKELFLQLSKTIPINPKRSEVFHINFERGMLLYALIAKFQPKTILEIGTAEGYSTLCMAWAMSDFNINGKIFTIDPKSHHKIIERRIKINENDEPVKMSLSTADLWKKFAQPEWIEKIEVLTGYSGDILRTKNFPKIDFCYIDGSHVYEAVKQDFFYILKLVSEKFNILFDDYVPNRNDGVTKIIDEDIVNNFETIFIKTNTKSQRIKLKNKLIEELIMCFISSDSLKKSLWETYDKKELDNFLNKYRFTANRIKIRKKVEKKIPFLKKIRFQWWKN